jgi:hypothetical protein
MNLAAGSHHDKTPKQSIPLCLTPTIASLQMLENAAKLHEKINR